jgi:hypothetical protein
MDGLNGRCQQARTATTSPLQGRCQVFTGYRSCRRETLAALRARRNSYMTPTDVKRRQAVFRAPWVGWRK